MMNLDSNILTQTVLFALCTLDWSDIVLLWTLFVFYLVLVLLDLLLTTRIDLLYFYTRRCDHLVKIVIIGQNGNRLLLCLLHLFLTSLFGFLFLLLLLLKLLLFDLFWKLPSILLHFLLVLFSFHFKKFLIRLLLFDWKLIPTLRCNLSQLHNTISRVAFSYRLLLFLEEKQKRRCWCLRFMTDDFGFLFAAVLCFFRFIVFLVFLLHLLGSFLRDLFNL